MSFRALQEVIPVFFMRRSEPDGRAVTLSLYRTDRGVFGDAIGPVAGDDVTGPLPIEEAVERAVAIANDRGVGVAVIDPEGHWDLRWGPLWVQGGPCCSPTPHVNPR